MTRSRVLWFLGVLALATPLLLAAFGREDGLTGDVWGNSLVMAGGLATASALLWGESGRSGARTASGAAPAGRSSRVAAR